MTDEYLDVEYQATPGSLADALTPQAKPFPGPGQVYTPPPEPDTPQGGELFDLVNPQAQTPQAHIKTSWTAAELRAAIFPEPRWFVPKYIPYGYIVLGGRPKIGKSWLALQLAIAKSTGGRVFGEIIPAGKVLYLALEDTARRLKERTAKMGLTDESDIVFKTQWEPFTQGGFATLQAEIIAREYQFVVIDTLTRALVGKRKIDQDDISEMTAIMANLQTMTSELDINILAIDHHTKPNGYDSDPIDDLLGSTGKSAVPDCIMGLYRQQGTQGAVLKSRGRDSEDLDLAIEFDHDTGCWQAIGNADDVRADSLAADIITAIRALTEDGETPTTTRIARFLDKGKGNISAVLADLVFKGKLRRGEKAGREVPYVVNNEASPYVPE